MSGDSKLQPARAFDDLSGIEQEAVREIFDAVSSRYGANSPQPSPDIGDVFSQAAHALARLRVQMHEPQIGYEKWLTLTVTAMLSTLNSDSLLPHYGDALIRPGLLIHRRPRTIEDSAQRVRSWFGGKPKMGEIPWPRDDSGRPIHFAAQLDLSEIAAVWREIDLPLEGSLAFFVGRKGAVVYIPPEVTDVTEPPEDMPEFLEAGIGLPGIDPTIPLWPVTFMPMPLTSGDYAARYDAQRSFIGSRFMWTKYQLSAAHLLGPSPRPQWWHTAIWMFQILERAERKNIDARILPGFLQIHEHLRRWTYQRSPWQKMTDEESRALIEIQRFISNQCRMCELCRESDQLLAFLEHSQNDRVSRPFFDPYAEIANIDFESTTMALLLCAPEEAYESLAVEARNRVNQEFLLPPNIAHHMLGVPAIINGDGEQRGYRYMLLQLAHDAIMFWQFNSGVYQFWISPEDLKRRNWAGSILTFDC